MLISVMTTSGRCWTAYSRAATPFCDGVNMLPELRQQLAKDVNRGSRIVDDENSPFEKFRLWG